MKKLLLVLCLFVANCNAAETWRDILESETQTSLGALAVAHNPGQNSVEVQLKGKTIPGLGADYSDASLSEVIQVSGHELVIIALHSGGVACPTEFAALEITPRLRLSKVFGNCNPTLMLTPKGDSLKIEMPAYFANPDLLSAKKKRELAKKVDGYVWINGEVKSLAGAP